MKKFKSLFVLLIAIAFVVPFAVSAKADKGNSNKDQNVVVDDFYNYDASDEVTINSYGKVDETPLEANKDKNGNYSYTFTYGEGSYKYVIIKQSNVDVFVWTERGIEVTNEFDYQREFLNKIKPLLSDNSITAETLKNAIFISGEGVHTSQEILDIAKDKNITLNGGIGDYEFIINEDGTVTLKTNAGATSHAYFGTYEFNYGDPEGEDNEEYYFEITPIGGDSATGFLFEETLSHLYNYNAMTSNSWFYAQKLNFADKDSITLNIQAGSAGLFEGGKVNKKGKTTGNVFSENKLNTVGNITLTKTVLEDGSFGYVVNYESNMKAPKLEDAVVGEHNKVAVIYSPRYQVSTDGKLSLKSVGSAMNKYEDGQVITLDKEEFDFIIHFNVKYYDYVKTVKVNEEEQA